MTDALEAAHTYAAKGWGVVPLYGVKDGVCACPTGAACPSAGKHPHGRGGRWNVLTGGANVQAWYDDNPDDNLGIVTGPDSGIFVLDVDGPTGIQSVTQLTIEHGPLPTTRVVKTGSGGLHYFFRHPDDFVVKNSASTLAANIDIRGKGGQVVAPPSRSARGVYEVLVDAEPADAPDWLLSALREHAEAAERGTRVEVKAAELVNMSGLPDRIRELIEEPYVEGRFRRFVRLHAIVAACREAGYTQGQTVTIISPWCDAVGKFKGRVPQEVARSWGKVEAEARGMTEWLGDVAVVSPPTPEIPDLEEDEEADFWRARPLLAHLHDFARARRVSPWAVLGVSLARISAGTPPVVHLPPIIGGRGSLNVFIGIVGDSGSGKGTAESAAADALRIDGFVSHNVGSGEGIAHGYKRRVKGELEWVNHSVLFSVPEIDSLAAQGDRKGATLMPQLRSGWSGEQLGFGYADPMKRIIVEAHEYRMALVAGIQPARAGCLLDDADGGTPQRFLWLPASDPAAPDRRPLEPAAETWACPQFFNTFGGQRMDVCDIAIDTIDEARLARLRGQGDALDGHALQCQLKTAAILALADKRFDVNDQDWHLAGVISRKSAAVRAGVAETLRRKYADANFARAEGEAHRAVIVDEKTTEASILRACRTIVRRLQRAGGTVPQGRLRTALGSKDRGNFEVAIERLIETGQIVAEEGERAVHYRIGETA